MLIKKNMIICFLAVLFFNNVETFAADKIFGVGVKMGMSRLEGDWKNPKLFPAGGLYASYTPIPYITLGGQLEFISLRTKDDAIRIRGDFTDSDKYKTLAIPFEIDARLNLMPFSRINPFGEVGVGGMWFKTTYDGELVNFDGFEQKKLDSVIKMGGGLEYRIDKKFSIAAGANYRYTLTDWLDLINNGDENDGILSIWTGVTYHIPIPSANDRDFDHVTDELDLQPAIPEDNNGIDDHDGYSEGGVPADFDYKTPLVTHYPVFVAEQGRDLILHAKIFSTSSLKATAILYRVQGTSKWKVTKMYSEGNNVYVGKIRKKNIDPRGIEYCIYAVADESKGIGYSGKMDKPIRVSVIKNAPAWRIATGIVSALSCGIASYLVIRKQSI